MSKLLYTDQCNEVVEERLKAELDLTVIRRISNWNIQDAAQILTDPNIEVAVFNTIDELTLMETGLLLFLCKPILITDKAIEEYPLLAKQIDYIDTACNLKNSQNSFVTWFKYTRA